MHTIAMARRRKTAVLRLACCKTEGLWRCLQHNCGLFKGRFRKVLTVSQV